MSHPHHEETAKNPYQAPASLPSDAESPVSRGLFTPADAGAHAIRGEYLAHEATVRTIGLLMYLKAAVGALGVAVLMISARGVEGILAQAGATTVSASGLKAVLFVSGTFGTLIYWILGAQLRALKNWARWIVVVLNGFLIFGQGATIGTLFQRGVTASVVLACVSMAVNLYIVYTLLVAEDGTVFSREYQSTISLTPSMKPRMGLRDQLLVFATVATFAFSQFLQLSGSQ